MSLSIRQAGPGDAAAIEAVLAEAARWLEDAGMPMWLPDEITTAGIAADVARGLFFVAECDGDAAGTIRFQLEDLLFWPDVPHDDSAFVHRLAVRRRFAGHGIASALLRWAVERAAELGKRYLRLDCEAARPKLRRVYEDFGFRWHSDRQVGPHFVARYEYVVRRSDRGVRLQPDRS